ncbi:MAG TPA: VWA domain-containing protein [Candidatus Binatia bacterium]|nr:VWA domain-containing protein [Candidatus Binatia bacterium]
MSPLFRYSRWDGTQRVELDADELLDALADDLLRDGDPRRALRRLMQHGLRGPDDRRLPGLRDLLERLRRERQQRLDRYDLGSSLDEIARALDRVIATERQALPHRVPDGRQRARRERFLDGLPRDPAGRLRRLQDYDFADPEARRLFEELLASLRRSMLAPFVTGLQAALRAMGPEDLARMREMLQDLNRLLAQRAAGEEPDFEAFRQKWGDRFPGVESLDQLLEQMGRRLAALQSLMQSLGPEQRAQLEAMMRELLLRDERLEAALRQLAAHLAELLPMDELVQRYPFRGEESLGLEQALGVMDELQQLDDLERTLRGVRSLEDLQRLPPEPVERLLGEEARRDLERLSDLARRLEEAGYLEGEDEALRLTARAIRRIADRALRDIFARLRRDRFGGHTIARAGAGGDQTDESKPYEFGDPFLLDLRETVMRAVERQGPGTPVALRPADFAVHRIEQRTQAATVLMLDMSRSMLNNGYVLPAKKVTLALGALIRGQFPRDALDVVGFSLYARRFEIEELATLGWSDWNVGTNMQAGFVLARRLLGRRPGANKQIILVTDGEPTAHLEDGVADFAYPPSRRTLEETLKEVQRCTREGITINTFMLERSPWLVQFVEQMTRLNRGRAFFTSPERLGEYVVVDFVRSRRHRLR